MAFQNLQKLSQNFDFPLVLLSYFISDFDRVSGSLHVIIRACISRVMMLSIVAVGFN